MSQVMHIGHVALSTKVVIFALRALPSDTDYTVRFTAITDDIRVFDARGSVIENHQVVSVLVANAIIAPRAVVPLHDDSLVGSLISMIVGRGSTRASSGCCCCCSCIGWLTNLYDCASMTLATVLFRPFPVKAADDSKANLQHVDRLMTPRRYATVVAV